MTSDHSDLTLANFVVAHPKLFVLTGAGCSTASGLGDYRDKQGQWKRAQPITGQVFIHDETARKRYWARSSVGWPLFSTAQPGPAHHALRQLQQQGYLQQLVTQNVDQLHQKAGHEGVVDLHGVLATVSCVQCGHRIQRDDYQHQLINANPWLSELSAAHAPDGDADLEVDDLAGMSVPACERCDALMKPDVVFFGENVDRDLVRFAMEALSQADALLVVGSSLMVYSGFRFCRDAQRRQQPIVIINDGATRADELASLALAGDCGQRLMTLAKHLS